MTTRTTDPRHAGTQTPEKLSPVDALRAIRRIVGDRDMTHAERVAVIGVILRADNGSGLAWATYRSLMEESGLAPATIRSALRKANGVHIEKAARGANGSIQYRIRPLQNVKRASEGEALQGTKRASQADALALHSAPSSASQTEAILTPVTNPTSNPTKRARVEWNGFSFTVPENILSGYCQRWPEIPRERIEREIRDAGDYHAEKRTKVKAPGGSLTGWLKRAFDPDGKPGGRRRARHVAPTYRVDEAAAVAVDLTTRS